MIITFRSWKVFEENGTRYRPSSLVYVNGEEIDGLRDVVERADGTLVIAGIGTVSFEQLEDVMDRLDITWMRLGQWHAITGEDGDLIDLGEITPGSTVKPLCGISVTFDHQAIRANAPAVTEPHCENCLRAISREMTE